MGRVLHLFSSDFRTTYIQDALNAIAAPKGFIVKWRYNKELVWDTVEPNNLVGHQALLWYVHAQLQADANQDMTPTPMAYVPLRHAKILEVREEVNYIFFKMAVQELVQPKEDYAGVWKDFQSAASHERLTGPARLKSKEFQPPTKYVMPTKTLTSLTTEGNCWVRLTDEVYTHLRNHAQHDNVTFFKFDEPKRRRRWCSSIPYSDKNDHFIIPENTWVELGYSFRRMQPKPDEHGHYVTVVTSSSEGIYCLAAERQEYGSPVDHQVIRFHTRHVETTHPSFGTLRVHTDPYLQGMNLQFNMEVRPKQWFRAIGNTLLAGAVCLAGVPALLPDDTEPVNKLLPLLCAGLITMVVRSLWGESRE